MSKPGRLGVHAPQRAAELLFDPWRTGSQAHSEAARQRRLHAVDEELPELPHDAVLVITREVRARAADFLKWRSRGTP